MENPFTTINDDENREESCRHISYNEIATKLIKDKLWLTALELHTELVEIGRELPQLRDFFSNPVNFEGTDTLALPRSSSQATLDSLDISRLSEDGERVVDDRVAVLEFELRKARETISSLRTNLTATVEGTSFKGGKCGTIKPLEKRALNFLINEYLLTHGYKITSNTFADENEDQDFEHWDDVGLNIPQPAQLLQLYRIGIKGDSSVQKEDVDTQTYPETTEQILKNETVDVAIQCEKSETKSDISGSFEELNKNELDQSKPIIFNETIDINFEEVEDEEFSDSDSPKRVSPTPRLSDYCPKPKSLQTGFESEVWLHLNQLKVFDCCEQLNYDTLITLLGLSLSAIIHQLPNNKELLPKAIPILVCTISLHPDEKPRDDLIKSLLNIKKRPNQEDRSIILTGLIKLCEIENETLNSQVLSNCMETMGQKYPEKRILVAQGCAHLSPLISVELRNSLLVSILKQLTDDKEEGVRAQSFISLAVIACNITVDKYPEFERLAMKGLTDKAENVVKTTLFLFLPVIARWALKSDILHKKLILNIISLLERLIQDQEAESKCCNVLNGLIHILPHLVMFASTSEYVTKSIGPEIPPPQFRTGFTDVCKGLCNPVLFYKGDYSVSSIIGAFDYYLQHSPPWPELIWITEKMIPKIVDIVEGVQSEKINLITSFIDFFEHLTAGFGPVFTTQYVKDIFLDRLTSLEKRLINDDHSSLSIIPVFCLGILAPFQQFEEELCQTLGRFLISLGLASAPIDSIKLTVVKLAEKNKHSNTILSALWQGVVHQNLNVKIATANLLEGIIAYSQEQVISSRIIPALVTLASDSEVKVRISTLPVYSIILEHTKNKDIMEKCQMQIQTIVNDPSVLDRSTIINVILSLASIGLHVGHSFREEVIFVALDNMTKAGFDLVEDRTEVAAALVEAFTSTIFTDISKNCMAVTLLPALRLLETLCKEVLTTHTQTVSTMVKEVEVRIGEPQTPTGSGTRIQLGPISPTNVEDMKQRVTKIFSSPIAKPNLPNLFWKK